MSANKSFSTETSERYSRALFEISKETAELGKVENDIKNFQLLIDSSIELKNFLKDPTQAISQQNKAINLLANHLSFSKNLKNFFLLLIEKRRISSKDLSQLELDNISKDLSDSTGSIIKFDYKFDKKLIGGLKLQLGSIMIDTSIKSKLKKYEQAMIEN